MKKQLPLPQPLALPSTSSTSSNTEMDTQTSMMTKMKTTTLLPRMFHSFDENGDGQISSEELYKCVQNVDRKELHMSMEEAKAIVEMLDSNGDGLLDLNDFIRLMECECKEEECKTLRDAFQVYEMEGQGCITPKSLSCALARLGQQRTVDECAAMIHHFDLNGDGVISFDEFRIMMR
ncbi:putative EF-hand domain-containing protein [Dioscorea sansibarensis]